MVDKPECFISGIDYWVPEGRLTNVQLSRESGAWDDQKIFEKTGVKERRIVAEDETALDLGVAAAQRLKERGVMDPANIEMLIFCTQTPDYCLPTTACLAQERLGLPTSCGAFDINLGCSGYIYGLAIARSLIVAGTVRNVLLITADTYTKLIHPLDKSVRTLFGDGASATLLTRNSGEARVLPHFVYGTDGKGAPNLIVPASGTRKPRSEATRREYRDESGNIRSDEHLFMNGSEIFLFTIRVIPKLVNDLLAATGCSADEVDWFIFHQASKFMLEHLMKKLRIPSPKMPIMLEQTGNTVSSTIPIVLRQCAEHGCFKPRQKLLLAGFGVGYSWGACMLEWCG